MGAVLGPFSSSHKVGSELEGVKSCDMICMAAMGCGAGNSIKKKPQGEKALCISKLHRGATLTA
jgi:hypothetical protein